MVDRPITAVIVDDHMVVAAGVRAWCAAADPPIDLIDAKDRVINVWTGPGATADVVIFDLQLTAQHHEFGEIRRLIDAGRGVIVHSRPTTQPWSHASNSALSRSSRRRGP